MGERFNRLLGQRARRAREAVQAAAAVARLRVDHVADLALWSLTTEIYLRPDPPLLKPRS